MSAQNVILSFSSNFFWSVKTYSRRNSRLSLLGSSFRAPSSDARSESGASEHDRTFESEFPKSDFINNIFVLRPWRSFGSERQIATEPTTSRAKIKLLLKRPRKDFGHPTKFSNFSGDKERPMYFELASNPSVRVESVEMVELEAGIQATRKFRDDSSQTLINEVRNAALNHSDDFYKDDVRLKTRKSKSAMTAMDSIVTPTNVTVLQGINIFPAGSKLEAKLPELSKTPVPISSLQHYPSSFMGEEIDPMWVMKQQLRKAEPKMTGVFEESDIFDLLKDDWSELQPIEFNLSKADDDKLKEYQSYVHKDIKSRKVSQVEFHPTLKYIFATAYGEFAEYDDRIKYRSVVRNSEPRYVLLWSIQDPLQPLLQLSTHEEVTRICFNPVYEGLLAGGVTNGSIVLWDFTQHMRRIKTRRRETRKVNSLNTLEGFVDEGSIATPTVYPAASSTDSNHLLFITGLDWLKSALPLRSQNKNYDQKHYQSYFQLVSTAADDQIKFWDMRPPPGYTWPKKSENPNSPVESFLYLKAKWAPFLTVHVNDSDPGEFDLPEKMNCLREKPRDFFHIVRSFCRMPDSFQLFEEPPHLRQSKRVMRRQESSLSEVRERDSLTPQTHQDTFKRVQPAATLNSHHAYPDESSKSFSLAFSGVNDLGGGDQTGLRSRIQGQGDLLSCKLFLGTEEGILATCDVCLNEDDVTSKGVMVTKPQRETYGHYGAIKAIVVSPFLPYLFITHTEWSFAVWTHGFEKPVLRSRNHSCRLTGVAWSMSQCSTFFVARSDGYLDVWDLLEKTRDPIVSQKVSDYKLSCVAVKKFSNKQQFVSCGDSSGAVILLQVPDYMMQSAIDSRQADLEERVMQEYLEREERHHLYVEEKRETRPVKSHEWLDNAAAVDKLANLFKTHEAAAYQQALQEEYQEYLELEYELQHKLGIYGPENKNEKDGTGDSIDGGSRDQNATLATSSYYSSVSKVASDWLSFSDDDTH
ncbi:dynein axonemal intermediate chain 3-like [Convolutriloba macropyga]|uniref:dynein axonemal intermediate chain 3-like n=1 Tax=Convolutriloba macropyga TaxID=536237 RepID=UPI003F52161A